MACSILGVEGRVRAPKWGLTKVTNINYSHGLVQTKQKVG